MSDLLNKASLVMVPSGYKEDTVYSVVPSDGSGDLSFTRASNGTRINSAGLVEVCPWNLLQYSEDFGNAIWFKSGATVTTNDATAPNGTLTADKIVFSGANKTINQPLNIDGAISTRFVYVKGTAGETISIDDIFTSQPNITLTGNWQLIGFTSATPNGYGFGISTYGGATARTIYLWGAQLNIGSTAKPYFPTTDRLNVPRLTYQNGGGGCPSLLLEKQSTNLATYSEDATQWSQGSTVGSITVTANQSISPDGTQNADKAQFPAVGSGGQFALLFFPFTASATAYTGSMFLRGENGGEVVWLSFTKDGVTYTQTLCTLTTSWQRFTLSSTLTSGADNLQIGVDTRDLAESSKPAQTIYVWGRQLEQSSYPTSYIPTTSSSATRVADACSKTGISSLIGASEGTFFVDAEINFNANFTILASLLNTASSFTNAVYWYVLNNTLEAAIWTTPQFTGWVQPSSALTNGRHKVALAWKANDFAYYLDGVQVAVSTSFSAVPSGMSKIDLANYVASYQSDQKFNEVVVFPTRLTNAELASLTTI